MTTSDTGFGMPNEMDTMRDVADLRDELSRLRSLNAALLAACEAAAQYMPCGEPSRGNGCIEPEGWAEVIETLNAAIAAAKGGA